MLVRDTLILTFGALQGPFRFNLFTKNILFEGISRVAGPSSLHVSCHAFEIAYNQLTQIVKNHSIGYKEKNITIIWLL